MKLEKIMVIPAIIAIPFLVLEIIFQSYQFVEIALYLLFASLFLTAIAYLVSVNEIRKLEKEIAERMDREED